MQASCERAWPGWPCDAEHQALIDAFADEGMTVVMSTHNLGQARRLARRVLYLEAGRVVVDRPVDAFFDTPLPDRAAQFLRGEDFDAGARLGSGMGQADRSAVG
jgi:ABC-type multidrug transport system ATPase subunit